MHNFLLFQQRPYLAKHRFFPFSEYLKEHFPYKVYKIPLHAGFTCPNRDGRAGEGVVPYCTNDSFSPNVQGPRIPIKEQVERGKAFHRKRYCTEKFIVYFHSFTNTYADVETLRQYYDEALGEKDVIGISIETRPDCVTDEILDLIYNYTGKYPVWIEYGLQTIPDNPLRHINRGHDYKIFYDTVTPTKKLRFIHACMLIRSLLILPQNLSEFIITYTPFCFSIRLRKHYINSNISKTTTHFIYFLKFVGRVLFQCY